MSRFETVMDFFNGKAAGRIIWYLDYNEAANLPPNFSDRLALYEDLNCTYIDGIGPSTAETDASGVCRGLNAKRRLCI